MAEKRLYGLGYLQILEDTGSFPSLTLVNDKFQVTSDTETGADAAQTIAGDFNIGAAYGTSTAGAPVYGGGGMFNIIGTGGSTKTQNILFGCCGKLDLQGTISSSYPAAALVGEIGDLTTGAYAAVLARMGGDSGVASATAAFGVDWNNSAGATKFTYGLDLGGAAPHDNYLGPTYGTADIRLASGGFIVSFTTPITANVTTTTLPAGALAKTTNATGRLSLFVSDGTRFQFLTNA